MAKYEYRIVPSPRRAKRVKGARTSQDRFARTLTEVINAEAAEGWEYLRADTLPMDEKKGMLSSATEVYQTVLVFRRSLAPQVTRLGETSRAATGAAPVPERDEPTFSRPVRREPEPEARPEEVEEPPQSGARKPSFRFDDDI